jgi:hypothetical protein
VGRAGIISIDPPQFTFTGTLPVVFAGVMAGLDLLL